MKMNNISGLFAGLITLDMQFLVDRYPEENTKNKATTYGVYTGGPATNAAIAFAYLGGNGSLYSPLGNNPFTGMITNELKQCKVNFIDITPQSDELPTFASVITSSNNGNRTVFSYAPPKVQANDNILNSIEISDYNIVLIDGFHIDAAIVIAKLANSHKIPVVIDGGSWKDRTEELLQYTNIAICSENFYPPNCSSTNDVIDYLIKNNVSNIAITRGNKSILCVANKKRFEIAVSNIQAVDTLGAGDIFHGAFCYYYAQQNNFETSLVKASKIAAKSCLTFGTREWMC